MKKCLLLIISIWSLTAKTQNQPNPMTQQKPYTIVILMNASPKWLSLSRDERSKFFEKELQPVFARVSHNVNIRLFDSEYFHASVSDFMILHTLHLKDYQLLIELLRDTKVYGAPYFEIKDIIIGQENLFEDFNEQLKKEQK